MKQDYCTPLSEVILLEVQGALLDASNESFAIDDNPLFTTDPNLVP